MVLIYIKLSPTRNMQRYQSRVTIIISVKVEDDDVTFLKEISTTLLSCKGYISGKNLTYLSALQQLCTNNYTLYSRITVPLYIMYAFSFRFSPSNSVTPVKQDHFNSIDSTHVNIHCHLPLDKYYKDKMDFVGHG